MIDREHDEIDFRKMVSWLGVAMIGGIWWWSLFTKGLLVTILWTVVIMAVMVLYMRLKDNRI